MTATARIKLADMEKAMKAAHRSGYAHARVVLDLSCQKIEVLLSDQLLDQTSSVLDDGWDDSIDDEPTS